MKTISRPRNIERAKENRPPSLARYLGWALMLGILGLGVEYRFAGTLLLRPAYRWTTQAIPGLALNGPGYSLDFRGTQLDWRLVSRGGGPGGPDFELIGYPFLRLSVWRRPDPGPDFGWEPGLLEQIELPSAFSGHLVVTPEHRIVGAFPIQEGFVLLRFESVPPPRGRAAETLVILNDIRRIAASFRSFDPRRVWHGQE